MFLIFFKGHLEITAFTSRISNNITQFDGWLSDCEDNFCDFLSHKEDYEGGYLFNFRALAKAEVLSDALTQTKICLRRARIPLVILARVTAESVLKRFGRPQRSTT